MTVVAPKKPSRLTRLLNGGWSTGLFVIGFVFDFVCVMNVPGVATFSGGDDPAAAIGTQGVLLCLLVLACWTTVFVRMRAPIAVLVAGGILMAVGVSYALALVGVYCALVRWPRKTTVIAAAASAAVLLFVAREAFTDWGHALAWTFAYDPSGDDPAWDIAAGIIALLSLALVAGLVAVRRARVEASVSRQQADRQHERADALDAQVERQAERERIARDLHDGLGHRLSSVALAAGAFETQAAQANADPALAQWARVMRQQAHEALEDVRGVVGGLRADTGAGSTPARASMRMLGALLADLRAAGHRIDAYVMVEGIDQAGPAIDAAAYRVVQESLTNATKHAPGMPISVSVDAAADRDIRIRVVNPIGAVSAGVPGGGRGIEGIRERAAAAGGTAWIGPYEGQFIVDVSLPWG